MPNTQSAKKRLRQSVVRRERNRAAKRTLRTECRQVLEAIKTGQVEQAEGELRNAVKKLDRAAAHKIIHPNAAARTKSRLSARVKAAKASK